MDILTAEGSIVCRLSISFLRVGAVRWVRAIVGAGPGAHILGIGSAQTAPAGPNTERTAPAKTQLARPAPKTQLAKTKLASVRDRAFLIPDPGRHRQTGQSPRCGFRAESRSERLPNGPDWPTR